MFIKLSVTLEVQELNTLTYQRAEQQNSRTKLNWKLTEWKLIHIN